MLIKKRKLASNNGRCEGFGKSQIIKVKRFNFSVLRRNPGKKGGPKMKVYPNSLLRTKEIKNDLAKIRLNP